MTISPHLTSPGSAFDLIADCSIFLKILSLFGLQDARLHWFPPTSLARPGMLGSLLLPSRPQTLSWGVTGPPLLYLHPLTGDLNKAEGSERHWHTEGLRDTAEVAAASRSKLRERPAPLSSCPSALPSLPLLRPHRFPCFSIPVSPLPASPSPRYTVHTLPTSPSPRYTVYTLTFFRFCFPVTLVNGAHSENSLKLQDSPGPLLPSLLILDIQLVTI